MNKENKKSGQKYYIEFWTLVYIFFVCALAGWIWEEFYCLVKHGFWVERGFLFGPILPIYGLGGITVYWLKEKLTGRSPWLLLLANFGALGAVEYISSWLLELIFNKRWWDYSHVPLNLGGRIHLAGILFFGIMGFASGQLVLPRIIYFIRSRKREGVILAAKIMLGIFASDVAASLIYHLSHSSA